MGVISNYSKSTFPGQGREVNLWRQVFGATNKEEGLTTTPPVVPGGSYARTLTGNTASFKRMLEAFRSRAPGGYTSNPQEQTNHYVGIVYEAIHRTNEQLAQSDFRVFQRDDTHPDGRREITRARDPQAYKLVELLEAPNRDDDFGDWVSDVNIQMDLTGSALTWMVPNAMGIPYEMYVVPTAIAMPQPIISPEYPEGAYRIQPIYPYGPFSTFPTPNTAAGALIPTEWMMRIKYKHPLIRWDGYSPTTALRLHIDEVESMDRSRWYAMKRGIEPSAVLNFDDLGPTDQLPEAEIARIQEEFASMFQGPENVGRLLISAPGSKLEPWGINPKDMDYQSGWEQLVSFVMAGYGITKPAAGMIDNASYATLFATLKQFHLLTLQPKANRIARKINRNLAPFFGDGLTVEIQCQRIDDHDVKNQKISLAMQGMCITKNEVRKELELPPTQEMWGNDIAGFPPQMMPLVPPGEDPQLAMLQQQQMMAQMGMGMPMMGAPAGNPAGGPPGANGGGDELMQILQQQGAGGLASLLAQNPDENQNRKGEPMPGNMNAGSLGDGRGPRGKHLGANRVFMNGKGYQANGNGTGNGTHWRKK